MTVDSDNPSLLSPAIAYRPAMRRGRRRPIVLGIFSILIGLLSLAGNGLAGAAFENAYVRWGRRPLSGSWSAADLARAVSMAHHTYGNPLTPVQIQAMKSALSDPRNHLLCDHADPLLYAIVLHHGDAQIETGARQWMRIGANGAIAPGGIHTDMRLRDILRGLSPGALIVYGLASIAAAVLGGWLSASGIVVMIHPRRGWRMHVWYGWSKLGVEFIGIAAWQWIIYRAHTDSAFGTVADADARDFTLTLGLCTAFGLAYAMIVLLSADRGRGDGDEGRMRDVG